MNEVHQVNWEQIAKINELRSRFVFHERFEELEKIFLGLLAARLLEVSNNASAEMRMISLIAEPGSGKSTAIRHLFDRSKEFVQDSPVPNAKLISLTISAKPTLKSVGLTILEELGFEMNRDRQNWYIWKLVRFHLREHQVVFVHLDEAQHLKLQGRKNDIPEIVDTLKNLSQDKSWPVGLLLSGTTDLSEIINFDDQLTRRMTGLVFKPLDIHADLENTVQLVANYCARVNLELDLGDPGEKLGQRIIHAAAYQFGLVNEFAVDAIEVALEADSSHLNRQHCAHAFQARKDCGEAFNPFLIQDFERIDTRKMFASKVDAR